MKSILIADTTREERDIGNIDGACDACSPGLIKMYQSYIEGRKELREINQAFQARYMSGRMGPDRSDCDFMMAYANSASMDLSTPSFEAHSMV